MAAERDENGRFKKGSTGNPNGRPKRKTEERYIRAMAREVKVDDWRGIIKTGIARAKAGDLGWARFLAEYLIGKPHQTVDADLTLNKMIIEVIGGYRNDCPPDST